MKRTKSANGAKSFVFEKGDGCRRRYARYMEEWRQRLPDPQRYSNGAMLRHPPEWYLEERHVLRRPSMGLLSLGRFAEWLLYSAQRRDPGGRAHAAAARLYRLVSRRMSAYVHRQAFGARLKRGTVALYAGACRSALAAAREAYAAYAEAKAPAERRGKRPLDTIREDMI